MTYQRHTLCYMEPHAKSLTSNTTENTNLLDYWLSQNFPLIFTRQPHSLDPGQIQLAIPYFNPVTQQKIRVSYLFAESFISYTKELPNLKELFPQLDINTLITMKVYGSYCWQYLTQKPYVQSSSDLDILIYYNNESLIELINLYSELRDKLPMTPIDGEVHFPNIGDCSWLELIRSSDTTTLLFKSINQIQLLPREDLYAVFPTLLF
ncbi:TPA: malonate decarboxylase holo-[acyl-carrier-protein] synthase [Legionella pneumophila]